MKTNAPSSYDWITQPLSLADAVALALQKNGTIQKSQRDLEATYGVIVQTKAIQLPKVRATANYTDNDPSSVDRFPFASAAGMDGFPSFHQGHQSWNANLQILQSIYEGGRIQSVRRSAVLTKDQAILQHQTVIANTMLEVRIAYYDVLLATNQIGVQEASVDLLTRELADTRSRFEVGTVPRFNVLRAEVELGNARPKLIRARNALRIAKNNLGSLLGYHIPHQVWEDIPLSLTDKMDDAPWELNLPKALSQALEKRTELAALRKTESIRAESIKTARAGFKPSVQLFAGYGARNSSFFDDLTRQVDGWNAGAQASWDIWDGNLTRGRILEAEALHNKAIVELDDTARTVEQEVRTAYSNFIEAREVLESQTKVQEQAEEALRLARSRQEAGSGTQLDVLSAQTALTDARNTQVQSLRDYDVTRARLERAMGGP